MFNPGDLTVFGPQSFLYPGQTGVFASPNGLYYAQFPDAQTGTNALVDYVQRHVSNGWTNLNQFVFGYLGTSTPNSANPAPQAYLNRVAQGSGIAAGGSLIGQDPLSIARGIATGEGTLSVFAPGAATGGTGLTGALGATGNDAQSDWGGGVSGFIDHALSWLGGGAPGDFSAGLNIITGNRTNDKGQNAYQAAGDSIGAQIQRALDNIGGQLSPILFRSGFAVVGVILVVIGLVAIVASNKQVQQAAATAAAAL